jgi:hypothetical protein
VKEMELEIPILVFDTEEVEVDVEYFSIDRDSLRCVRHMLEEECRNIFGEECNLDRICRITLWKLGRTLKIE